MNFLPFSQEYMVLVSVMGGMILGFFWDVYRIIRRYISLNNLSLAIGDILYWIVSVYLSLELIFYISYGNVRFFILIGFCFGALLYFYGLSSYILKLFYFLIDSIIKLVKKIISLLIEPIKFIITKVRIFLYPYKLKLIKEKEKLNKRYKFFKYKLKKISKNRKLLYNNKKHSKLEDKRRREGLKSVKRHKNRNKRKNTGRQK